MQVSEVFDINVTLVMKNEEDSDGAASLDLTAGNLAEDEFD